MTDTDTQTKPMSDKDRSIWLLVAVLRTLFDDDTAINHGPRVEGVELVVDAFAAVRADERERCAQVAEMEKCPPISTENWFHTGWRAVASAIAKEIRNRK